MRIIAGKWRARRIEWPDQGKTRPIADRVKEALFDVLGSRMETPGALPELTVADVFCGGGSLGLEALSRGAERACFFERDRDALRILKGNLASLETGPEATIAATDIWRMGVRGPTNWPPFDLLFLDPPFADVRDVSSESRVAWLLRRIARKGAAAPGATAVLRHESRVAVPDQLGDDWTVENRREYGSNALTFLVRSNCTAETSEPQQRDGEEDEFADSSQ